MLKNQLPQSKLPYTDHLFRITSATKFVEFGRVIILCSFSLRSGEKVTNSSKKNSVSKVLFIEAIHLGLKPDNWGDKFAFLADSVNFPKEEISKEDLSVVPVYLDTKISSAIGGKLIRIILQRNCIIY